jgi:magnesium chelatase accessory protein
MSAPDWAVEGRDWPNREFSRFTEAGGLRWHVQVGGEGPALLLLHGTGAATHSWRDLLPLLAREFTVVAPDLPGHGFTGSLRNGGLAAVAGAIVELLDALELKPELAVGHSAGAAILVRMALDGQLSAKAIMSVNGALLPFPGMAKLIFPAMARMLFVNPLASRLFAVQARMTDVGDFLYRSTGSRIDRRGVALYARLFAKSGHVDGALRMMAHWDLDGLYRDLPGLETPSILIAGANDKAVPPSAAKRVARRLKHSETIFLPDLGHLAHEEAPEAIAEIVMRVAAEHAIVASAKGAAA